MSIEAGRLYVVATPIGNLGDIGRRALEVLDAVDLIAAEDTRHALVLLAHYGIRTPMCTLQVHNEGESTTRVLGRLRRGEAIALVCDAGTPLISDPGFRLVREAIAQGCVVVPVPGPSALLCALSAAGLPTDRFVFEGFLPRAPSARRRRLEGLRKEPRTMVFYESRHRVLDSLQVLAEVFGPQRPAVLARELTKLYESFYRGPIGELIRTLAEDPRRQRGEFVLLVAGAPPPCGDELDAEARRVLELLLGELPPRRAAALAAAITGARKNRLYEQALRRAPSPGG